MLIVSLAHAIRCEWRCSSERSEPGLNSCPSYVASLRRWSQADGWTSHFHAVRGKAGTASQDLWRLSKSWSGMRYGFGPSSRDARKRSLQRLTPDPNTPTPAAENHVRVHTTALCFQDAPGDRSCRGLAAKTTGRLVKADSVDLLAGPRVKQTTPVAHSLIVNHWPWKDFDSPLEALPGLAVALFALSRGMATDLIARRSGASDRFDFLWSL